MHVRSTTKPYSSICSDLLLFFTGAISAVLVFFVFYTIISTTSPSTLFSFPKLLTPNRNTSSVHSNAPLTYTITSPLTDWDSRRQNWLSHHHPASKSNILLVSGSQPNPCENPIGDHLLLRLFKNKADYCRIHGCNFFYNTALFHPQMKEYWNKIPTIRSAMVAHPKAEWIWWVDADAVFTDMDFDLPLDKYKNHNMVVHGWPNMVYEKTSWTGLNAGVFLIRNCQWSLDFMEIWAKMGPQTPDYETWGKTLKSVIKDKLYPESDDQSGLVYLLLKEKGKLGDKVYLENEYYFEGYWVEILGKLRNMTKMEDLEVETVREKKITGGEGRRPFITHFTGCQPCSGRHNKIYSGKECWDGLKFALDFADDQVLRRYGFRHVGGSKAGEVRPVKV